MNSLKRILIVEDDRDISRSMMLILQLEGFQVDVAHDGEEGLLKLRGGWIPDLIFLDLMMPKIDGFQFHAEIQKDKLLKDIPIVIFTGDGNTVQKGKRVNAKAALKKPADMESIVAAARKHAG